MTEVVEAPPTLEELQTQVNNLRIGAGIIYSVLQTVYQLHDITEVTDENDQVHEACGHCSGLAEVVIAYPCPTVGILLENFIVEETPEEAPAEEETPAE